MTNTELIKQEIDRRIDNIVDPDTGVVDKDHTQEYYVLQELLDFSDSLQQEQPEVELENYISNKLRELGADLINHRPYSFNRGVNVGKINAYRDILDRLNARKV